MTFLLNLVKIERNRDIVCANRRGQKVGSVHGFQMAGIDLIATTSRQGDDNGFSIFTKNVKQAAVEISHSNVTLGRSGWLGEIREIWNKGTNLLLQPLIKLANNDSVVILQENHAGNLRGNKTKPSNTKVALRLRLWCNRGQRNPERASCRTCGTVTWPGPIAGG